MKSKLSFWTMVLLVMTTAIIAYAASNNAQNITSTINTARFIMFGGDYTIAEKNTQSGVFKLDTYSGKAWILRVMIENGKRYERWEAIPENEMPAIKPSTNINSIP